jgi:hypothetical protein
MLNRRYALLGWAVWKGGKVVAKRRARSMVPSTLSESRSPGPLLVVPVLALAGVAAWFLFFRRRGAEFEAELEAEPEPVG